MSATRGSRYHYRHAEPHAEALALLPPFYRVVTRLDTELLHAPHENSYYVPRERLADLLAELILAGGAETIWHVEPCETPPAESGVGWPDPELPPANRVGLPDPDSPGFNPGLRRRSPSGTEDGGHCTSFPNAERDPSLRSG